MTNNHCHYNKSNCFTKFICLAIIHLYFIRTFSYVLSSVEYIHNLKRKKKNWEEAILFQLKKTTSLTEVSNFINLNFFSNLGLNIFLCMILYFILVLIWAYGSWYCDWYLGFPKVRSKCYGSIYVRRGVWWHLDVFWIKWWGRW